MADERNTVQEKDRKRTVLDPECMKAAFNLEIEDTKTGDIREEILDLEEEVNHLKSKSRQKEGYRDELGVRFWKKARAENKDWFREMTEHGLVITFKRIKDDDTGETIGVELHAQDPQEEMVKRMRRIFKKLDDAEER